MHVPSHNLPSTALALRGWGIWLEVTRPRGPSNKRTTPHTRRGGSKGLVQGATPSSPRGCSKLLKSAERPARRVTGSPGREVAAQCWDAHCSKVQQMAAGAVTGTGAEQGTVPKWHQASASMSGQVLKASQVGGFRGSELRLHSIARHLLYTQG